MPRIQSLCTSVILFGFLFPRPASAQDLVRFRLETTDLSSTPISSVQVGDDFLLHVTVEDLRDLSPGEGGVFSAYLDVLFDSEFVSVVSDAGNPLGFDVEFGPDYENGQSGNIDTSGLIDEVGAFDNFTPLGTDEATLFTVMFHADQAGQFDFIGDFADVLPLHDSFVFGSFGSIPLTLTGGAWQNAAEPLDVDDNGFITPLDALRGVNALNDGFGDPITGLLPIAKPIESGFFDVDGDGFISPRDSLFIINFLNLGAGPIFTDPLASDDITFQSASITIVPEPTTVALAALALIGLLAHGHRRRRA